MPAVDSGSLGGRALRCGSGLRLRRTHAPSLLLFCLAAAGCATYGSSMEPVLKALTSEDYARALRQMDKKQDRASALWLAERGLLLRYAGRLEESNESLAAALLRQEDLYTRSVSEEALSLAVNDAIRPYRLKDYEVPFLHLYPILNYLELGDSEGALVEARALSQSLEMRRMAEDGQADDWGLGRLISALVFESAEEWNDALVAYRASLDAYRARPAEALGEEGNKPDVFTASLGAQEAPISVPASGEGQESSGKLSRGGEAVCALAEEGAARCALRLGLTAEDAGVSTEVFLRVAGEAKPKGDENRSAHLVVWIEEGLVPATEEVHFQVPILEEEKGWDEDQLDGWSRSVGERALDVRCHRWDARGVDIAYFLDVALPILPPVAFPRPFGYAASLQLSKSPARHEEGAEPDSGSRSLATGHEAPAPGKLIALIRPAEDLGALAREDLDRRYPVVAARAAARAILKALATRAVEKKSGEVAGKLTNLLGVAVERADTRSWSTLPGRIGLAVLEVPLEKEEERIDGALQVDAAAPAPPVGAGGRLALSAGGWHFFSCRLFP